MNEILKLFLIKIQSRPMMRLYRITFFSVVSVFLVSVSEFVGLTPEINPTLKMYILGILTAIIAAIDKAIRDAENETVSNQ
jgi:hypothetical protein